MPRFWSETRESRTQEIIADVATWAWVSLWAVLAYRLFTVLAAYAEAGRVLQRGGANLQDVGDSLGDSLSGVPLIGEGIGDLSRSGFDAAGAPFIYVGGELEDLLLLIAGLVGALVLAVTLIPWLTRYLPWRARRLADLRHADRAINRRDGGPTSPDIQRLLASRALHRLRYEDLLRHTPDPLGDFATERFDRLARAELASVGLLPQATDRAS